jgi:hypothetical protein
LKNVPYYIDNPELLASDSEHYAEPYCRATFPEFFCHPSEARERVTWGRAEIGWHNKVSPDELRELFGWKGLRLIRSRLGATMTKARESVPQPVKTPVKQTLSPGLRQSRRERQRLESMEAGRTGSTPLFGATFEFADARAFLDAYHEHFVRQIYRFRPTSESPLVVDGHAGFGVGVLYFRSLFPRSRILAFEAEPADFAILERNCETYGLEGVALTPADPLAETIAHAVTPDRLATPEAGREDECSLTSQLGELGADTIDLLKLRVDASQGARLLGLSSLLATVESIVVDCRYRVREPQDLSPLLAALEDAGFLIGIQSPESSLTQPLIAIPGGGIEGGRLRILGYRV